MYVESVVSAYGDVFVEGKVGSENLFKFFGQVGEGRTVRSVLGGLTVEVLFYLLILEEELLTLFRREMIGDVL